MSSSAASTRFRPRVAVDKRRRVSRACTTCRQLKRRCIPGPGNSCRKCDQNKLSCFFEEVPKQAETTEDSSPESRPVKWQNMTSFYATIMAQMRRLHPDLELQPRHLDTLDQLFQFYQTPRKQDDPYSSPGKEYQTECKRLYYPVCECGMINSRCFSSVAPASEPLALDTDFMAKVSRTVTEASGCFLANDAESDPSTTGAKVAHGDEATAIAIDCLTHFPSQSRAVALTRISLRGHQSNFYYCDQDRFQCRLSALYSNGLKSPLVTPAFVCFAAIAMAVGCQFKHLERDSNEMEDASTKEEDENEMPGTQYMRLSQRLLPVALEERSMETVQSCLLMAFFVLATDDLESYYIYTGLALRTAITLSLHRLDRQEGLQLVSLEESKRLFWTVYCIERRSSMMVGRSETLPIDNITTPLPVWMMQLDKYDIDRVDRLTAFINLTQIQTQLLKRRPSNASCYDLQQAQHLLTKWQEDLPTSCRSYDSHSTRPNIHLQIMYHMTWMQLGRTSLLFIAKASLRKVPDKVKPASSQSESTLSKLCATSARAVVDLILDLRNHGQIAFFSHLDLQSCSSSITLLLLARVLDEDVISLEKIQETLGVLDLMSEKSQYAKRGTRLVRQLYEALNPPMSSTKGQERDSIAPTLDFTITKRQLNGALLDGSLEDGPLTDHIDHMDDIDGMGVQRVDTEDFNSTHDPVHEIDDDFMTSTFGSDLEAWLNTYSTPDLYFFGFDGLDTL
ncbi:hypothetical protein KAF25_010458 [Fusarium avenaceum]|uniref:Zn(2)-C6 fungal-type domain-containing protein n=1 Tax=Fusarium avenaceum TaxID=40199 RepID=A0A9P7KQC8_9HYPO|nr:hypothetical protein KAF25_010458 [Fusarium avenaceum]